MLVQKKDSGELRKVVEDIMFIGVVNGNGLVLNDHLEQSLFHLRDHQPTWYKVGWIPKGMLQRKLKRRMEKRKKP